ncbi:hypothetical protein A0J61_08045 [Choanephora cucurbitarum]|uniref:Uncharacterized protein n=1 Tax=Choanephora cucurbitarum TaxID=101091 RepID=A0A1C7N4A9_9FUNG|nr:hypothetical protein A0J61_08045 [Choanephora cucurbitarum]
MLITRSLLNQVLVKRNVLASLYLVPMPFFLPDSPRQSTCSVQRWVLIQTIACLLPLDYSLANEYTK